MRIGQTPVDFYDHKLSDRIGVMEHLINGKDVGPMIGDEMSFDKNVTVKVNKVNSVIGVIR